MAFPLAKRAFPIVNFSFLTRQISKIFRIYRQPCIDSNKKKKKKENNAPYNAPTRVETRVVQRIKSSTRISVMQWQKSRKGKAVTADSGLSNETR